ncbi:MAG: DEAD/DEAH box helicase, partial [Proteobacteria bacterium]|nr:DEAD/DEAH box helicase [Pseudomonadota bacterium]
KLADKFLSNPKYIEVARPASTNTNIAQHKVPVASSRVKREVLRHLLRTDNVTTAIIFANRKTTVRELNKSLRQHGFASGEIHGDMDQPARLAELQRFKDGDINILCASDVAARGLDIKGVSHVFNFDTPWHPDDYVHRIGRTGRAGATGRSFTLVAPEDAEAIENVEKLTGGKVPVFEVALDGKSERAPREDKPRREERPRREAREERSGDDKPRREREPRAPRQARDDRAETSREERPRREREPREERPRRDEQPRREARQDRPRDDRPRRDAPEPREAPGVWNGPVPGFLGVSFGE